MKYPLDEILKIALKEENKQQTGIWYLGLDYRGGKLNIDVCGSDLLSGIKRTRYYYGGKKFNDDAIREFGHLKIDTSQIKRMEYFPTITGYEACISNLKTLNPDYLLFQMPVQEKAPSGKIIIPQNKNEVFVNLMIDIAEFLKEKYK